MRRLLRTLLGVVLGYALMVILITLVQESWLGGIGWNQSSGPVLALGGLLTCLSGAVGAGAATWIARGANRVAATVMAVLVVLETSTLLATERLSGPLWFDLIAAASLVGAILIGGEVVLRRVEVRRSAAVA